MATIITDDANYKAIANAIRNKTGNSATYTPDNMAARIASIPAGTPGGPGVNVNNRNVATLYGPKIVNVWGGQRFRSILVQNQYTHQFGDGGMVNANANVIMIAAPIEEYPTGGFSGATFGELHIDTTGTTISEISATGLLNGINAPDGVVIIDTGFSKSTASTNNGVFTTSAATANIGQLKIEYLGDKTTIAQRECAATMCTRLYLSLFDGTVTLGPSSFNGCRIDYMYLGGSINTINSSAFFVSSSAGTPAKAVFLSKNITTIGTNAFRGHNNCKFYTDATSKPSGWTNPPFGASNGTITYGYSISTFLNEHGFVQ